MLAQRYSHCTFPCGSPWSVLSVLLRQERISTCTVRSRLLSGDIVRLAKVQTWAWPCAVAFGKNCLEQLTIPAAEPHGVWGESRVVHSTHKSP